MQEERKKKIRGPKQNTTPNLGDKVLELLGGILKFMLLFINKQNSTFLSKNIQADSIYMHMSS